MSEVSGQSDHMDAPSRMSMICDPPNRSTISLITIHSILIIIHRLRFDSIHLGFFLLLLCSSLFHSLLLSPPLHSCLLLPLLLLSNESKSRRRRNKVPSRFSLAVSSFLPIYLSPLSFFVLRFRLWVDSWGGGGCLLNSLPRSSIPCLSFHLTLSLENSSRTEVEDD